MDSTAHALAVFFCSAVRLMNCCPPQIVYVSRRAVAQVARLVIVLSPTLRTWQYVQKLKVEFRSRVYPTTISEDP